MNTQKTATTHYKRVNLTLPADTLRLIFSVVEKGDRSSFVNQAVRSYIKEASRTNLRKKLRQGAIARASRDLSLAEEWFLVDEKIWPK